MRRQHPETAKPELERWSHDPSTGYIGAGAKAETGMGKVGDNSASEEAAAEKAGKR
jgi:hypothetical protein